MTATVVACARCGKRLRNGAWVFSPWTRSHYCHASSFECSVCRTSDPEPADTEEPDTTAYRTATAALVDALDNLDDAILALGDGS